MKFVYSLLNLLFITSSAFSQYLLKPEQIFDGEEMRRDWVVTVVESQIEYVGSPNDLKDSEKYEVINLDGLTLMPGLIEGHSHILLHPYNETSWNDQVLKESYAERAIRAANHVEASLMAGITTMRDLGSEGAGYVDVGVKESIEKGVISGPRLLVAGPAIVATGSYGPKGFHDGVKVPLGAEEADGEDNLIAEVRRQIGNGVDLIKVYADYRWGPNGRAMPTFTQQEIELMVRVAESSGRYVVAHSATAEGMRRAALAGVETIEHGDGGTPEVYQIMKENNIALCPTLAAVDAISQYRGWNKAKDPDPERIIKKKKSFKQALKSGVKICFGGDVGVYPHGDNARELELMVEYGMDAKDVLIAATSGNAKTFHLDDQVGSIKAGMMADIIAIQGDPTENISATREVRFVMKNGLIHLNDK